MLEQAVPSTFLPALFDDKATWKAAVERSDVRLQWDPDHLPGGDKCQRRAIQVGLRGAALECYGKREILEIIDLTEFVARQRPHAETWQRGDLLAPSEQVYVPLNREICKKLGLDLP